MIRWLNNYFFDEDEITWSDGFWFYGVIIGIILWTVFILFIA